MSYPPVRQKHETQAVTAADVQEIYQDELGRAGADNFIQGWVDSGMSLDEIRQAVNDSPEGQNYDTTGLAASLDNPGVLPTSDGASKKPSRRLLRPSWSHSIIRNCLTVRHSRLDLIISREGLGSGDLTEDTLRDAIIAGAQGSDRLLLRSLSVGVAPYLTRHRRCLAEDQQGEHSTQKQASLRAATANT